MNDFLQSIRSGNFSKDNNNNKQRYNQGQRPRRQYEPNGNYSRNGNGNVNEKKFRPRHQNDPLISEETTNTIKETLLKIAANQEAGLIISERRAVAEERKAAAFEFIAANLGNFTPEKSAVTEEAVVSSVVSPEVIVSEIETPVEQAESVSASTPTTTVAAEKPTTELSKDEVLEMIATMRNNGSTYNEIASHLAGLDLPTFSGRGKWHAQTIHRLCQNV